jgi:thiamine biosynthesis lipoprotein ApbE
VGTADVQLTTEQERLLRKADANAGQVFVHPETMAVLSRKAAKALVRLGMLSVGVGGLGNGWHAVTEHGRAWLAAHPKRDPAVELLRDVFTTRTPTN